MSIRISHGDTVIHIKIPTMKVISRTLKLHQGYLLGESVSKYLRQEAIRWKRVSLYVTNRIKHGLTIIAEKQRSLGGERTLDLGAFGSCWMSVAIAEGNSAFARD